MATKMYFFFSFIFVTFILPLQVICQTVQDDWTAPAAPDGSTPLQSGTKFTLLWKSNLRGSFETYCPSCDTTKLDLWITNFNGTKYQSKIGRGIDLTTTSSYDWNVQIASGEFSEKDFWVFRFTFFDSVDPYTQQISSPGFRINGLIKAVSTSTVESSTSTSATSATLASSSIATTSTSVTSSSTIIPQATEQTSVAYSSSENNVWISGVVVGPILGLGLGAVLTWFCLRKRRKQKALEAQGNTRHGQPDWSQQYLPDHNPAEKYSHTVNMDSQPWQRQDADQDRRIVEAPDHMTAVQPVELWQGNYRS